MLAECCLTRTVRTPLCALLLLSLLCNSIATATQPELRKTKLPTFVKICHRRDAHLNACVRNSINALAPLIPHGIPELFLPPIEPLVVPEVRMDQDSGAIYMHSSYKNIHVRGLSNYRLIDVNVDTEKWKFSLILNFPHISMVADYKIKGKIMLMPLLGDGKCSANFTNTNVSTTIIVERHETTDGRLHLRTKNIRVSYAIEGTQLHLDNLFNGDEALGERMNAFLNENWQSLSEEVRPLLEKAVSKIVRSSADKLFAAYSYDELLPE